MTRTTSCAGGPTSARPLPAERRLARYHKDFQPRIQALAGRHPRLTDLAVSFPGLLFALAVPRKGFQTESAIAHATNGSPLKVVAKLASVPLWLRSLPPEAFTRALPVLPDDTVFRREVSNFLPRSFRRAPSWLSEVAHAAEWGGERIACWIAREAVLMNKPVPVKQLRLVCLWAWHCGRPGLAAHAMCETLWQPSLRFATALAAAEKWLERLELYLSLGDDDVEDMWLRPGSVAGYDFVPLASAAAIYEEARAMQNCLVTYGACVARGRIRLWSMRRDGERVATVEVGQCCQPLLQIIQMKRARNRACSSEEWWAALQWLHGHGLPELAQRRVTKPEENVLQRPLWIALWRPYWLAKGYIPEWLPLMPSPAALAALF
jgi:hypothetical protein